MLNVDPEGIENRSVRKKLKKKKQPFVSDGAGWLFSVDRHGKLMGFRNSTFPVAIYGCMDTFFRYMNFLFVWDSSSKPLTIGLRHIQHLFETKRLPFNIRIDHRTERGKLGAIHAFLSDNIGDLDDSTDSVIYGLSTTNKIERWWRALHKRMEMYFKQQLSELLQTGSYNPSSVTDRRTGIPSHMFQFPENYGTEDKSFVINIDAICKAAEASGVLDAPDHYIEEDLRTEFHS